VILQLFKDFVVPILTFSAGLLGGFYPHVQKPLTEYRTILSEISRTMIRNGILMHSEFELPPSSAEQSKINTELQALYDVLRDFHARLLSSTSTLPKLSIPFLRVLQLVRSEQDIREGARMLIGISNQIVQRNKDLPHLTTLIRRLGVVLDINVGE
jgi:hypothetical protein